MMFKSDEDAKMPAPVEPTSVSSPEPASLDAPTITKSKGKYYRLGGFLPKGPYFRASSTGAKDSSSFRENAGNERTQSYDNIETRRRGISLQENVFSSSIVRRLSNSFRHSASSPRSSSDSMPSFMRRSISSISDTASPRIEGGKLRRGACVSTHFGTGTVIDYRHADKFYIIQLVPTSTAYLREDAIIREIKAIVGERVKTRWGLATVEQYYVDEDMYNIALDWRWDDDHVWRMKATTKKFEKIKTNTLVQHTKSMLVTGYSSIMESASTGYANVAAKINTNNTHKKHSDKSQGYVGKVMTPFGVCTVLEVRPDQFFVVQAKFGAIAYFHVDSVKLIERRTHFACGERIKTPYGTGEIVVFRDVDEIYEIKLDTGGSTTPMMLYLSDLHAESGMIVPLNETGTHSRFSSILNMTKSSMYSAASGGLNTFTSVKSKVTTMAVNKMTKSKFQKGERVVTTFGSGFIVDARPLEKIYEVQLRRLKFTGYFHESALKTFPYERVTHFVIDGKMVQVPEMSKNVPDYKRRQIITTALLSARSES